jgi:RHS repeat-associated protein
MRKRFLASSLLVLAILLPIPLDALNPVCKSTCSPDPSSPTYASTIKARSLPLNSRGHATAFSILIAGGHRHATTNVGSESYNYAMPILHLPGRNGLDLDLTLYYNSHVWTIDPSASTATFNADRDFPAYGFRLGFGLIEGPFANNINTSSYTLTEVDGTKRELRFTSNSTFESFDSSYMDWNTTTLKLLRKDGTIWLYQQVASTTFYRPIQIEDTNGNFISITYSTATNADAQAINTITDTLGRVITFNYNSSLQLTSVSGPAFGGGTQNFATFAWNTSQPLNFNFASPLTVADSLTSGSTINVITSCTYPNSTGYAFVYGDWGIVDRINQTSANGTVRSYVSYNYPTAATALTSAPTWTQETVNDGVNNAVWTYSTVLTAGLVSAMTVTDPVGNVSTTNLNTSGWQRGLPSSSTLADSHNTTLRTVTTSWTQDNTSLTYALNPRVASATATLNDSGQQSAAVYSYSANYGNVTQLEEQDFGLALTRTTQIDYLSDSPHISAHIYDRPSQVRIYDGYSNLISRADFAYDGGTLTSESGALQHDANYGTSFTTRGIVTSVTRYTNAAAASGPITRAYTYDILGNQLTAQVDCCNLKTFTFSSATQFAYPDSLVRGPSGIQFTTSWTYNFNTGLVITQSDENSQVTHLNYDNVNRLTSVTRPDTVIISTSFDDNAAFPSATTTTPIDSSNSIVQTQTTDGVGRTTKVETKSGGGTSYSIVETQYDALGRVSQSSNPHSSTETALWTVYTYDPLSRPLTVTPPGSMGNSQYAYSGNSTTVTDPAGKQRQTFRDALGRLTFVYEPGYDDGGPAGGSVTIQGAEQHTSIPPTVYDSGYISITVGNRTDGFSYGRYSTPSSLAASLAQRINGDTNSPVTASVSGATVNLVAKQGGMLGNYITLQSTSSTNDPNDFPEASFYGSTSGSTLSGGTDGTGNDGHPPTLNTPFITVYNYDPLNDLLSIAQGVQSRSYVYDSLGRPTSVTTPEAGNVAYTYYDYGKVNTRSDARGEVTTYGFDGLHRLSTISYSTVSGVAATPGVNFTYDQGGAAANANDRLTTMTDGVGSEAYQYDILGRTTKLTKTIGSTAYPINYAYNYSSELTSVTYPSNRQVQQSFDPIGRLSQIQSGGTNFLSNIAYNSASEPTSLSYGNTVQAAFTYNAQLQLQSLAYTKGTSTVFSLNYDYTTGVPGDSGQIEKITDNVDSTKTTTYTFDAWLRLKSAANAQWTITETYDRFGNRKSQSAPMMNNVTPSATTNRLTDAGYAYDLAGNMTNDGSNTMVYDGENRVASASNSGAAGAYSYDGNSLRVKKCVSNCTSPTTTTVYIFSGSKVIAEYDNGAAVGSPSREYIYSGSALLATISGSSTTYHHADHLSERVATDQNGNVARTFGHYPFGETWYETGSASKWKFTSYERDSESGNDYAMMRSYINRLGRFSSPDPVRGDLGNPQSMNRYAYVANNPPNAVDPGGLSDVPIYQSAFYRDCVWYSCYRGGSFAGGNYGGASSSGIPQGIIMISPLWAIEAANEGRYLSILNTGWDPELGQYEWGWHDLETNLRLALMNPDCASLIGGTEVAADLVSNMSFVDANTAFSVIQLTAPPPSPLVDFSAYWDWLESNKAPYARVVSGATPALTWMVDGKVLGYVLGPSFFTLSIGQQMTVMIDEFHHASLATSGGDVTHHGMTLSDWAKEISEKCGTDIPPEFSQ